MDTELIRARARWWSICLVLCVVWLSGCVGPAGSPTPTFSGASGPFGIVDVNYTMTDEHGHTLKLQRAGTVWVPALDLNTGGPVPGRAMVGVRVGFDLTEGSPAGTVIEGRVRYALDRTEQPLEVGLKTLRRGPQGSEGTVCKTIQPGAQSRVLAAIGGDVAFELDETALRGEGWLACVTIPGSTLFDDDGYEIDLEGIQTKDPSGQSSWHFHTFDLVVVPK